tara:strand:- start:324 stop:1253 length:930 start_codon:yes stop_codon:yes gene_type:complete
MDIDMENNIVAQSNELVMSTYTMTTKEKELLFTCISQIDSRPEAPQINKQTKFSLTVEQIRDVFYKDSYDKNLYRDLADASNRLFDREVSIKIGEEKVLKTRFVSGILFDPKEAKVTLTFAEDILPYLTQLKANFTKYRLVEISQLSSTHAMRLYELIVCWTGQFQYSQKLSLDEFRYVMGVSGKYKQFGQLKESVIDKAIEEVNENTDYKVSVDYRKVGRSFVSLTLKFHKKSLARLEDKEGKLSDSKIESIVRSKQFVDDYNDCHRLSHNGKMNTDDFRKEMTDYLKTYPDEFTKKPLEYYLKTPNS